MLAKKESLSFISFENQRIVSCEPPLGEFGKERGLLCRSLSLGGPGSHRVSLRRTSLIDCRLPALDRVSLSCIEYHA